MAAVMTLPVGVEGRSIGNRNIVLSPTWLIEVSGPTVGVNVEALKARADAGDQLGRALGSFIGAGGLAGMGTAGKYLKRAYDVWLAAGRST